MNQARPNSFRSGPDEHGHFGIFGGRFVAETLMPLILDLEKAYNAAKADPAFQAEMNGHLRDYVGRPSPLYFAERLTEHLREVSAASGRAGGAKIYFKREELNHTGSHKVNNVLGQIMLARRMGKKRIIAETGAGQHGVATATLCARFGLRMRGLYGRGRRGAAAAQCDPHGDAGRKGVSGAVGHAHAEGRHERGAARLGHQRRTTPSIASARWRARIPIRRWCATSSPSSATRPASRCRRRKAACRICWSPASAAAPTPWACSIPSSTIPAVEIFGVEAAGHGLTQLHAASIAGGRPGVLHGNRTYLLMNEDGQIQDAHSISAGLDYPGIGPEHSWLHEVGRVKYLSATDDEALAAFQLLSRLEGIIPALEPAHAIAKVMELAPARAKDHLMVVNLSGRGDKDVPQVGDISEGEEDELTRIDARFAQLKKEGRSAFVTFLMAGDPDPATSLAIIKAMPKAGADMIEIGMPFTDPMADGPSIQAAGLRALKAGMTLKKTLELVRGFRAGDDATPVVLMGYYNPIYIYGVDKFLTDAKSAGVDGLIIVDLPRGGRRRAVCARAEGRAEFHSPRDADHRRQAAAGRARQHLGLCLLRLDHGHHRRGRGRLERRRRGRGAHQAAHEIAGLRRLRHPHAGHRACDRRACRWRRGRHRAGRCLAAAASMRTARRRQRPSARWPISRLRWPRASAAPNRRRNR